MEEGVQSEKKIKNLWKTIPARKRTILSLCALCGFLIPFFWGASSVPIDVSIADLVSTPQTFNGKQVSSRGYMTVEQVFLKPTNFYLRDETGNMIRLELSKFPNQAQIIEYAGKMVEVSGLFDADKKEIQVTSFTTNA